MSGIKKESEKLTRGKVKKGIVIVAAAVLIFMGVRALFIFWLRGKEVSSIQTDREVIERYFPDFPETQGLYWVSAVEKRAIGPAITELYIYAQLEEAEFAHLIEGTSYSEVLSLPLFFQPKQLKGPFRWRRLEESKHPLRLHSELHRTIYIELEKSLVFIEANGTNL
ncbi:hypothetical protein [Candidatus Enterococcus clewellii]|uniref:Uncharacterized protein n=1 Tax=Candidatus Enterococcus clewellii TaxID=1834193 RepID=A0AAQ3W463_9ENTE|nr:hypothetical protein [Enterococcus sp. 9E7_DIV0242]